MGASSGSRGGRDIVAFFAGRLAHLVNGNDHLPETAKTVEMKPFSLYERISRDLANNRRYVDNLVGVWAYPPPHGPEEAADFYFDAVLDRPISGRKGETTSADRLARAIDASAQGPWTPRADKADLSTWKAIVGGPTRLRRRQAAGELFELSNLILKCLDAANRPYAEVLRLGLCPKEWLTGAEAVGVNTLKSANAFLKALKSGMNLDFGRRPTTAELEAAFIAAPVPGFKSASEFASSTLGGAILTRVAGQDQTYFVAFEDVEATLGGEIPDESETVLMAPEEAAPYLDRALAAGAIDAPERHLLGALLSGRGLAEAIGADLGLRRRVKVEYAGDIGAFVDDLSSRTAKFVIEAESRP